MWDCHVSLSSEKSVIFENNASVNAFQKIKEPWLNRHKRFILLLLLRGLMQTTSPISRYINSRYQI
jgi:hypothetical protein